MTNNKSNTNLKPKIKSAFRQAGGYVTRKDIGKAIRLRREDRPEFDRIIAAMIARGELREKEDKLMLAEKPDTLVKAVVKAKPAAAKGQYIKSCTVVSTMGPGVKVNTAKYL